MVSHMKDAKSLSYLSLNNAVFYLSDAILDNSLYLIHMFSGENIYLLGTWFVHVIDVK